MVPKVTWWLILAVLSTPVAAQEQSGGASGSFYVVYHGPGAKWIAGKPFEEQLGSQLHLDYLAKLTAERKLIMGGQFDDAAGGMVILGVDSRAEAERVAREDPAVAAGLLSVQVRQWVTEFSTRRLVTRREAIERPKKNQPFRIESTRVPAPINIDKQ